MVLKRSKMKPVGNVMKLFMKEATVKMSENCSSWALQSGREKRRSQEPRMGRLIPLHPPPSCQV